MTRLPFCRCCERCFQRGGLVACATRITDESQATRRASFETSHVSESNGRRRSKSRLRVGAKSALFAHLIVLVRQGECAVVRESPNPYLRRTDVVDWDHPAVAEQARALS